LEIWGRSLTTAGILLLPVAGFGLTTTIPVADQQSSEPQRLPITTSHPEALALFEHGIVNYENYHLDEAVADWRKAVQLDPKFAIADVWISLVTNDPKEDSFTVSPRSSESVISFNTISTRVADSVRDSPTFWYTASHRSARVTVLPAIA